MTPAKKPAALPAQQTEPPRETFVIAHGPNENGHDHMVTSAQNPDLAEERAAKAAASAADATTDYPPSGEEE
jgi:hypothetical protein